MSKSMVDVAYEKLDKVKNSMAFVDLWKKVCKKLLFNEQQNEDNIAQFYTDLSLDDRFVCVKNNKWDLRLRHTYEEVVVETSHIIIDESDDVDEFEDNANLENEDEA